MKRRPAKLPARRLPRQPRARRTVDAILEAVRRVLLREGAGAVTTNRVAEVAGVSIGSVYQYFPDKQAIFVALRERHVEEMGRVVEPRLVALAGAPLPVLMRGLVEAMIAAHAAEPALHRVLSTEIPQGELGTRDLETRLIGLLRLALAGARGLGSRRRLDRVLFVLCPMLEALTHAAVLDRPPALSLAAATDEVTRAVLAYLTAAR